MTTIEKVKDYKGWIKIDKTFLINDDDSAYQAALSRRKKEIEHKTLESRMSKLESDLSEILKILKAKAE